MTTPAAVDDAGGLTSIGKALEVLTAFDGPGTTRGLQEIVLRTGFPKSTTHRLLTILIDHRLVERRGRRYALATRLFELGNLVPACRPRQLRDVAMPHLCELYRATRLTVSLAVLDGDDVVYLERLSHPTHPRPPVPVGGRLPARGSALGTVLLAWAASTRPGRLAAAPGPDTARLAAVRAAGWAAEPGPAAPGVASIAVPVRPTADAAVAAISLTRFGDNRPPRTHLPDLQRACAAVSRGLSPLLHLTPDAV